MASVVHDPSPPAPPPQQQQQQQHAQPQQALQQPGTSAPQQSIQVGRLLHAHVQALRKDWLPISACAVTKVASSFSESAGLRRQPDATHARWPERIIAARTHDVTATYQLALPHGCRGQYAFLPRAFVSRWHGIYYRRGQLERALLVHPVQALPDSKKRFLSQLQQIQQNGEPPSAWLLSLMECASCGLLLTLALA